MMETAAAKLKFTFLYSTGHAARVDAEARVRAHLKLHSVEIGSPLPEPGEAAPLYHRDRPDTMIAKLFHRVTGEGEGHFEIRSKSQDLGHQESGEN
ncbi:MAG: hypothetical protein AAF468_12490 [Pseudomonadota bacterium]